MLNKVVFTGFAESDLQEMLWQRIAFVAKEIKRIDRDDPNYSTELKDADGLILRLGMSADAELMNGAPNLRYIGMYGTGYGRIDTSTARERGIVVSNVADYSTESVAELVVGMALDVLRDLANEQGRAKKGNVDETSFVGRDLRSLTVGVVGAGFIGQRVISLFSEGFGSRVFYWSRTRRQNIESERVAYTDLKQLIETADLVSLHLAANEETNRILTPAFIEQLKRGAVLVNTAPNELVDLDAIKERCSEGTLTYCMDHADEFEPSEFDSLRSTPNMHIYPPIGYATKEATERKAKILVENMEAFVSGSPQNHVNP